MFTMMRYQCWSWGNANTPADRVSTGLGTLNSKLYMMMRSRAGDPKRKSQAEKQFYLYISSFDHTSVLLIVQHSGKVSDRSLGQYF